jgi:hypothetical protein
MDKVGKVLQEIALEREHVSFVSNKPIYNIGRENFAHVLAKGKNKYPKFATYDKNIVLLTFHEHHLYDNGTEQQRNDYAAQVAAQGGKCDWQKLYDIREDLLKEYAEKHTTNIAKL